MGNFNTIQSGKEYVKLLCNLIISVSSPNKQWELLINDYLIMSLFCRRRSKYKRKPAVDSFNKPVGTHGVKTVGVDNLGDFSRNFDLCICIVTWNMNGQVEITSYNNLN